VRVVGIDAAVDFLDVVAVGVVVVEAEIDGGLTQPRLDVEKEEHVDPVVMIVPVLELVDVVHMDGVSDTQSI